MRAGAEAAWEEVVFRELTDRLTRVIVVLEYDSLSGMFPRDEVWNAGSARDQWLKGVGVGVFLDLPVIGSVRFDLGHDLRGGVVVRSVAGFGF